MSPALLKKYLAAARRVADHVVLKPQGFVFAPHPVVTDTDRDKYCVQRILDFYARHKVDLADYFLAAWKYRHRVQLGRPMDDLSRFASEANLSAKYLALVWSALTEGEVNVGPLAAVRKLWRELPAESARSGCERMRDLVSHLRRQLPPKIGKPRVSGISNGSQTLVLWRNRQLASRHRSYSGEVFADFRKLAEQLKGANPGLSSAVTGLFAASSESRSRRRPRSRSCRRMRRNSAT